MSICLYLYISINLSALLGIAQELHVLKSVMNVFKIKSLILNSNLYHATSSIQTCTMLHLPFKPIHPTSSVQTYTCHISRSNLYTLHLPFKPIHAASSVQTYTRYIFRSNLYILHLPLKPIHATSSVQTYTCYIFR